MLSNLLMDTVLNKIFICVLGGERIGMKYHLCPWLFLPHLLLCSGQTPPPPRPLPPWPCPLLHGREAKPLLPDQLWYNQKYLQCKQERTHLFIQPHAPGEKREIKSIQEYSHRQFSTLQAQQVSVYKLTVISTELIPIQ